MELQPSIAQLYIVNGTRHESSVVPGLSVRLKPAHASRYRQKDSLFVHLSLTGPLEETAPLMGDLVRLLEQNFYRARGSVTTALRQAIVSMNDRLIGVNLQSGGAKRIGALSCAVLRDNSLYLAQVGEAFAFLGHRFGLERQPSAAPPLMTPLGSTAGIDIRFSHHRLQDGTTLLLCDPRLAHIPSAEFSPALVETNKRESVDDLLQLLEDETTRLLWVQFVSDTDDAGASAPRQRDEVTPPSAVFLPPVRQAPKRDHSFREPVARGQRPQRPEVVPTAAAADPTPAPAVALTPAADLDTDDGDDVSAARDLQMSARHSAAQGLSALSRMVGWLARLLARLRVGDDSAESSATPSAGVAVLLAIFIPIIVVGAAMGIYIERGESSQIEQMRVELAQALSDGLAAEQEGNDPRPYYEFILARSQDAEALRPNDQVINQTVSNASDALDRLDGITRLEARVLAELDDSAELGAVVLQNIIEAGLYTLDTANNRLYFHALDTTFTNTIDRPVLIVGEGDPVSDYVVSDVVDLIWRPRGAEVAQDGVALLDAGGGFITYYPDTQQPRVVRLGLASEWGTPTRLATYQERVYVLDTANALIWRYIPNGENLRSDSAYRAIEDLEDLDQAADVIIAPDDGSVIIAYQDGRIRRYANGRTLWSEADLVSKGLDPPMAAPSSMALAGSGISSSLFVADQGTERIVQISRVGNVIAQFKARDADGNETFGRVTDFQVLESPLRVYFVAGNKLYIAEQP